MSRIIVIEHLTLDGVFQGPARPDEDRRDGFGQGGWSTADDDPSLQEVLGARMGASWSLLVGRVTYEDLFGYWPRQPRPNMIADALDNIEKFVVSTTLTEPLEWQNSTLLNSEASAAVTTLKRVHAKTLVIFGSGELLQSLMRHGLIDEYVLQIHPLVLGEGRRLFPDGGQQASLTMIESVTTSTGVMVATYRSTHG